MIPLSVDFVHTTTSHEKKARVLEKIKAREDGKSKVQSEKEKERPKSRELTFFLISIFLHNHNFHFHSSLFFLYSANYSDKLLFDKLLLRMKKDNSDNSAQQVQQLFSAVEEKQHPHKDHKGMIEIY